MINKNTHLNEPFLLTPAFIEKIWGGNKLKNGYHKKTDIENLAETWECSIQQNGLSIIASGFFSGKTLKEIIENNPEILGSNTKDLKDFPILVKLIDAKQDLSIQVHPDDEYAFIHENGNHGKHELWYILEADKNSKIIYGLNHSVSKTDIINSINNDCINNYVQSIEVKKGDVFFIKPGTIHAIGSGILLAEIQQNSDITYRLYDYNRIEKNGKTRELHIKKALDVANLDVAITPNQPMRVLRYSKSCASELLCRCKYFQVERLLIDTEHTEKKYSTRTDCNTFVVYLCIIGSGIMYYNENDAIMYKKGDCIFIPSNSVNISFQGKSELLRISC